ncbi:MAG: hypothetical protein IJK26_11020 [Clostridia bacterium]|nr:hypothetical protein [Clostridia bacterium]
MRVDNELISWFKIVFWIDNGILLFICLMIIFSKDTSNKILSIVFAILVFGVFFLPNLLYYRFFSSLVIDIKTTDETIVLSNGKKTKEYNKTQCVEIRCSKVANVWILRFDDRKLYRVSQNEYISISPNAFSEWFNRKFVYPDGINKPISYPFNRENFPNAVIDIFEK